MRNRISILCLLLFNTALLLPFGTLITVCFGYRLELVSVKAFSVFLMAISVLLVFLAKRDGENCDNHIIQTLFALMTPVALVNANFYILADNSKLVIICMLIVMLCSLYLTVKLGKSFALKIVVLFLSFILAIPVGYMGGISFLFGGMGKNTVVKEVLSPDGAYCAKVIDNDQGATGGNTLVDVYEGEPVNFLLFKIMKKPQRVYQGSWGEGEKMKISWKDEKCLVVNGRECVLN